MRYALSNELAIDLYDQKNAYKDRIKNVSVTRPISVFHKFKNSYLIIAGILLTVIFWPLIFPLFMTYKYAKYSIYAYPFKSGNISIKSDDVIIASSHRIQDLLPGIPLSKRPSLCFTLPWIQVPKLQHIEGINSVDALSVLKFKHINQIFLNVFRGLFSWIKYVRRPSHILQSYVLFEFFLSAKIIDILVEKGVKNFWFANHYDKWAILLDQKTVGGSTLVQHGLLNPDFIVPKKLDNLSQVYTLDKKSINIFKSNYISNSDKIKFHILNKTLKLISVPNAKSSILIISRPAQFEMDKILIPKISQTNKEISIYIKPHPLFNKSKYFKELKVVKNCRIIEDDTFYPDVDIVISGYSSLALEYELAGKKIIWLPKENISSVARKVKSHFKDV